MGNRPHGDGLLPMCGPLAPDSVGSVAPVLSRDRPDEMLRVGAVLEATDLHPGRTGHDHLRVLAALPLAVFAMGPLTLEADDVAGSRKQLDRALAKEPSLEPIAVAVFGGVVDPAKMRFPFTHMDASDARDWDAIRYWTDDIAGLIERRTISA